METITRRRAPGASRLLDECFDGLMVAIIVVGLRILMAHLG